MFFIFQFCFLWFCMCTFIWNWHFTWEFCSLRLPPCWSPWQNLQSDDRTVPVQGRSDRNDVQQMRQGLPTVQVTHCAVHQWVFVFLFKLPPSSLSSSVWRRRLYKKKRISEVLCSPNVERDFQRSLHSHSLRWSSGTRDWEAIFHLPFVVPSFFSGERSSVCCHVCQISVSKMSSGDKDIKYLFELRYLLHHGCTKDPKVQCGRKQPNFALGFWTQLWRNNFSFLAQPSALFSWTMMISVLLLGTVDSNVTPGDVLAGESS